MLLLFTAIIRCLLMHLKKNILLNINENSEKGTSFFLHKKDKDPTSVWSHYLKSADNLAAKCKKCGVILKTLGGSTKGLHTHLSTKHNLKVTSAEKNLPSSSQQLNGARTDEKPPTK